MEVGEQARRRRGSESRASRRAWSPPDPPAVRPSVAADSSARRLVVPTATMRPPRAIVAATASAVSWGIRYHSRCIRCSDRSFVFTGWKVPAPTCSVTNARPTPRAASRCQHRVIEVQAGGWRGDRTGRARVDGLVARGCRPARGGARCRAAAARRRAHRATRRADRCRRTAAARTGRRARRPSRARCPGDRSTPPIAGGSAGAQLHPRLVASPRLAPPAVRPCRRWTCARRRAP